jgi:hypothetical protein
MCLKKPTNTPIIHSYVRPPNAQWSSGFLIINTFQILPRHDSAYDCHPQGVVSVHMIAILRGSWVCIWLPSSGDRECAYDRHPQGVVSVHMIAILRGSWVCIWLPSSGGRECAYDRHPQGIVSVHMIAILRGSWVCIWSPSSGGRECAYDRHPQGIVSVHMIAILRGSWVYIWLPSSGGRECAHDRHPQGVVSVVSTTPRPLYPRERPGTHCTGGWVGPRAGMDVCEKSRPHWDSIPGASSP